jgi:hypothetical protein
VIAAGALLVNSRKAEPPAAPAVTAAPKPAAGGAQGRRQVDSRPSVRQHERREGQRVLHGRHSGGHPDEPRPGPRTPCRVAHLGRAIPRDTKKPIRQIASELDVSYILEGSVRRSGSKVRVTGQLINALTDEHVWAKAYDRDLTDIFSIQSELAQAIAAELKAALSPEEKAMLDRKPTENPEAYDLYLKSRKVRRDRGHRQAAGAPGAGGCPGPLLRARMGRPGGLLRREGVQLPRGNR